jgi:hypothetical protein
MYSRVEQPESISEAKWYPIRHSAAGYTFPTAAVIHEVRLGNDYIHVALTDGRILSIPLWWIPTVHHAPADEREKFEVNRSRTMIIWDPDKGEINDEIRIADYL